MKKIFKNKTILITGGTGSFGKAMISYLLKNVNNFKEIKIFSRDEKKQFDMRNDYNNKKLNFFIGDVRDYDSVLNVMSNVDFVFHAAALKQVPSCEFFPIEAVKTNIIGTENVLNACNRTNVQKAIFLSTDKSVQPINAMGMSKALMEKTIIAKAKYVRKNLILCITRYGNVIGSRGSVVPTFIQQIKSNSKLTITNLEMTRFMMTLEEAVELVIHAFNKGKNGDLFIRKSPASNIKTIAEAISIFYKKKLNIQVIGTRLGEKIHESLLSLEEKKNAIDLGIFYKISNLKKNFEYNNYFTIGDDSKILNDYNSKNTNQLDVFQTLKLLKKSRVFLRN
jgi:UDP-N-acetylglucosamine 4,6-dehydratase